MKLKRIIFWLLLIVGVVERANSTPQSIIVSPPIQIDTSAIRHPWILTDTSGVLLYCETANDSGNHLMLYRIADPTSSDGIVMNSFMFGGKPHMPVVHSAGDKKVIFWNEDVSESHPIENSDTTIQHRLVLFEGDYPTSDELATRHELEYVYRNFEMTPGAVLIDSLLYFDRCVWDFWLYLDNATRFRLGCLNVNSNQLTSFDKTTWTHGQTALLPARDTLLWGSSYVMCASINQHSICLNYVKWYSLKYLVDGQDVREQYIENRSSANAPHYDNVTCGRTDSGYVIGLSDVHKLYRVDGTSGAISPLTGFSNNLYTTYGYSNLYPVQTPTANCVFVVPNNPVTQILLLAFDRRWNFADSQTITLEAIPLELSPFVYDPHSDRIVFAYSSYITDNYSSARIFVQSVKLDIVTGIQDDDPQLPVRFILNQNYPNPFNPSTQIEFSIPKRSHVSLTIFNVLGQRVRTLVNGIQPPGEHSVKWDGTDDLGKAVASGVYMGRIEAEGYSQSIKMILQK